jgi:hypothetical protein
MTKAPNARRKLSLASQRREGLCPVAAADGASVSTSMSASQRSSVLARAGRAAVTIVTRLAWPRLT